MWQVMQKFNKRFRSKQVILSRKMSNLFKQIGIINVIARNIGRYRGKKPYRWESGVKYPGFTYYPRNEDFADPPYEPTKLFRVQRIKPVKGTPYWERNILKEFGLLEKQSDIAVIKNIPENNARLWRIKHLVKISPITFPNGFPEDTNGAFLKENGELVVMKKVGFENRMHETEKFENNPKKLDADTLRRDSRMKWLSGW